LKHVIAIYPGTFDPPTNGHLDLIQRGSAIFEELVVAILRNSEKVRIDSFEGLLVEYAAKQNAGAVLRGIRAVSDYEYELQMAWMNRKLDPRLETVFMMPAEAYSYLSSRLVREIMHLGGKVSGLVPPLIEQRMREKIKGDPTSIPGKTPRRKNRS
jgi:pantetheine-phosphate adenylyltransferase